MFTGNKIREDSGVLTEEGTTVLLIDDYIPLLNVLKLLLEQAGYCVMTATDGDEAIELYKTNPYAIDIVISDVHMPRVDGVTAFKQMQEIDPEVKMLFMSFDYSKAQEREFLRMGAIGFLEKPFNLPQLQMKLSAAFQH